MVAMMDGTYTDLGPQVAPALFGYLIGVACAVSSFLFGRHVHGWWRLVHAPPPSLPEPDSLDAGVVMAENGSLSPEGANQQSCRRGRIDAKECSTSCRETFSVFIGIRVSPFLLLALLLAAFFTADFVEGIPFYRKMWMSSLLSPFGTVLRWKLSKLNAARGPWEALSWVPWGTFAANMIAVVISLVMEGLELRYVHPGINGYEWLVAVLPAIETGFAGSLSTVSTFVKEIVDMESPGQQFVYTWGSLALAMLVGLLCYSPIVRS